MTLQLSAALLESIREHGARAYPNECCGALLGTVDAEGGKQVRALLPLDNRREGEAARTRFLVTAEDYLHVEEAARAQQFDILGFYHSHPDHPARPSTYDLEHAFPWYSYLIVRVSRGEPQEATSWVLAEDRSRFVEESLGAPAASNSG